MGGCFTLFPDEMFADLFTELDNHEHPTGVRISDADMHALSLRRHE